MKRTLAIFTLLTIVSSFAFAEYFEKVRTYQVGPGSIYSYYEEHSHPWALHVTEIDLTNSYITLETKKADDLILGRESTSSMSTRSDNEGHRIVSAINGDFYNVYTGQPINNQVLNGECVQARTYHRSAFTYSEGGIPSIVIPIFSGFIISKDTSDQIVSHSLNSVNMTRYENHIVIYNDYIGNSSTANQWGYECLATPISKWYVNDTVYCVIESREDTVGNMAIPEGKFVISGHGTGREFLMNNCEVGDTVKILQKFANSPKRITQYIGGGPWMLRNGVDVTASNTEGVAANFYAVRHPRTAVGFNADSTVAYFVVVDGRLEHSIGMTLHELSAFMRSIGAAHATNLDGGGSSTFTVRSDVMNIPSDGWERIVANALMCVSSAPDSDLAIVQVERDSIAVYKNNTFNVPMSGWDIYYNPKPIPTGSSLQVSFTNGLGSYTDGEFTCSDQDMNGYIYTDLNGVKDSMIVHIISIDSLTSYPQSVLTDTLRPINFFVYGCLDGGVKEVLDNNVFEFELLNETIGSIDENGVFTPAQQGESELVIHYGQDSDTAFICVENGVGEILLQEVESLDNWTLSGNNLDTNLTAIQLIDRNTGEGSKAFRIDYTTTDDGIIVLETNPERVYGVPSEYLIDAMSDGSNHRLYLVFNDANGHEYRFKAAGFFNDNDGFITKTISSEAIIPGDDGEYYPMYLKQIYIDLANGVRSGTLYFDRIRCTYPGWTSIDQDPNARIPTEFKLLQNYPNPFNPTTAISYSISAKTSMDRQLSAFSQVDLSVFDLSGKKVATLVNDSFSVGNYTVHFDASVLPGGVYFYRLKTDNWTDTKKMLLIK
ncbi:MAG: phosphodiester glycosidase family protein [Candidatus Marinimicrobia bacterium]|nr:phosphodiester glycosidase family protein [Candidatus Neomarinimicrobiota bacterium]